LFVVRFLCDAQQRLINPDPTSSPAYPGPTSFSPYIPRPTPLLTLAACTPSLPLSLTPPPLATSLLTLPPLPLPLPSRHAPQPRR
jgi:hypothetical protein